MRERITARMSYSAHARTKGTSTQAHKLTSIQARLRLRAYVRAGIGLLRACIDAMFRACMYECLKACLYVFMIVHSNVHPLYTFTYADGRARMLVR